MERITGNLLRKSRFFLQFGAVAGLLLGGASVHLSAQTDVASAALPMETTTEVVYPRGEASESKPAPSRSIGRPSPADPLLPGGLHELGVWSGFSLHSGHYLGYDKGVKFFPIDVRYSYRFLLRAPFSVRYTPEATVLAIIDEPNQPVWASTNPTTANRVSKGVGLSPVGFQWDWMPRSRIQPFFSENSGLLYFSQRVLSPVGSQMLFSTDLGLGIHFFTGLRQSVTVGYRYQHMSNANISDRNPGTDANTFYVGYSRFHTKGVQ